MEKQMEKETEPTLEEKIMERFTEEEKIAYQIAKDHLGTSFDIVRSNGYSKWASNPSKFS